MHLYHPQSVESDLGRAQHKDSPGWPRSNRKPQMLPLSSGPYFYLMPQEPESQVSRGWVYGKVLTTICHKLTLGSHPLRSHPGSKLPTDVRPTDSQDNLHLHLVGEDSSSLIHFC